MLGKIYRGFAAAVSLCLLSGMLAAVPAAGSAAGQDNVLVNGDFEQIEGAAVPGWSPDGDAANVTVSTAVYAQGLHSLKIDDPSAKQSAGALSDPVGVSPFANVVLEAKVRTESGEGGKADLRFYNAEGRLVSVVSGLVNGPSGGWSDLRVAASAPKDGVRVRAAFYSPAEKTTVFYADAARMTVQTAPAEIRNLGPQSTSLTVMTGAYGKDRDGRDVLYTVVQGDPAELVVMDVATGRTEAQLPLVALDGSHVSAAWAITVASDGKAYIGSTPNGTLFQYDPQTEKVRTLGKPVPTDTVIWAMVPGENGKIYGGTGYSQSLFEYDPASDQMRILTSFKSASQDQHIRSLAYDPERKALYAGGANIAKLYAYDLTTGQKLNISPPEFAGKTAVYDLQYTGGKLFVRVDPGPEMYVYDPATRIWLVKGNKEYNTRGFSPVSPDNRVFYTYYETMPDGKQQWSLYAYDMATGAYGSLGLDVKGPGVSFGYVRLEDPNYPGVTLVGLAGNSGRAFYYNLATGRLNTPELPIPPQFAELFNIGKSIDGKMLSAGFISGGGLGVYSPTLDETKRYPQLGQVEGFGSLGGKMYFGVYPKASLFEYDPRQPWNRTDPSLPNNPVKLGQIGSDQDRPLAVLGVEELNKLFIGTYPIAGKTGGALTIYDPVSGSFDVKRNLIPEHSINSLLYRDGKLYMATSAMNGGSGELAIYDTASGKVEFETVPAEGKKAVTALTWGPDGGIWGMAEGTLFIFDPASWQFVYRDDKFPRADYAHSNPRLEVGTDGNVYGSIYTGYVADKTYTGKLFKIDAATRQLTVLLESNVEKLAQDDFGHFYFKYGSELMQYTDPGLIVKPAGVDLQLDAVRLRPGEQTACEFRLLLEKGRTTNELSGAKIEYLSSRPKVADFSSDGKITAYHPGLTELSVRITLDGVTVESAPVRLLVTGPQ
jgi:WD40 repeat protein